MAEMELKDFIRDALVQIAHGVRGANEELKKPPYQHPQQTVSDSFVLRQSRSESKIPGVRFDVALTVGSQQKEKVGLFVALASLGGGISEERGKGNEIVQRIQFEVGIEYDRT